MSDMDAMAAELAAANRGELEAPTAPPANNPEPAPDLTPGTPVDEGTTPPVEDSFAPGIDPLTLPPEMQAIYRNMQGHFTRSTQSLREKEAALDGLDVEEARGALDFLNALNSDPQFAMSVHQELSQALQSAGMTPAQADAAAAAELSPDVDDEGEYGSVPPDVLQRLERTEQFMQTYESQQQQASLQAELTRQETAIRKGHPEWDNDDIASVYSLAYAHGGDLNKAADAYVAEQARWATRFMAGKSSVPSGTPAGTGYAQAPPEAFATTDAATAAAEEMFRNSFGS